MTATTNVPPIVWVNGAPVLPQESDIKTGVFTDINKAFGGGLNPADNTPQGQLTASETAIIGDKNSQIAYISNQVNPVYATGQWQDAIGQIYFMQRIAAAGTVVNCTCIGAVGTIIPAGATASDTAGYIYSSTSSATIPASGSITVQFQNNTAGAIACNAGSLNNIYSAIPGWDSITNPAAGALGNLVETQQAFEYRRKQSVAANAVNSVTAIQGAILALPGVIGAFTIDNPTNATITYGSTNYPIPANSTLLSVAGGNVQQIAQTYWQKKACGSPYAPGNTSQVVYDTNYGIPYPSYTVPFLIPTSTPTYFVVNIKNIPTLPTNIIQLIQSAIISSFYGNDGGVKAAIAQTTFASRYYANVISTNQSVEILSIFVGTSSNPSSLQVQYGIDQLPVTSLSQITVNLI